MPASFAQPSPWATFAAGKILGRVGYREEVMVLVLVSFESEPYCTILLLEGTLNDTDHCEIIIDDLIDKGLPKILTMNIYNKMYKVIMHKSTVNSTSEIW